NTDLIDNDDPSGAPRDFDLSQINFGAIIKASDYDGDSVSLDGRFKITVRDDIPIATGGSATVSGTGYEDGLTSANSGGQSVGNAELPDHGPVATTISSSLLSGLVTAGADESLAFSLNTAVSGAVKTPGGDAVTSKGQPVLFGKNGSDIVGFVDGDSDGTYDS